MQPRRGCCCWCWGGRKGRIFGVPGPFVARLRCTPLLHLRARILPLRRALLLPRSRAQLHRALEAGDATATERSLKRGPRPTRTRGRAGPEAEPIDPSGLKAPLCPPPAPGTAPGAPLRTAGKPGSGSHPLLILIVRRIGACFHDRKPPPYRSPGARGGAGARPTGASPVEEPPDPPIPPPRGPPGPQGPARRGEPSHTGQQKFLLFSSSRSAWRRRGARARGS